MKEFFIIVLALFVLILPIITISVIYLAFAINVFDNSDFWYGYMAYFGTVTLAAVSLWQNENANAISKRLAEMSCKDKIAYLVPQKNQTIRGSTIEFTFFKRGNSFGFITDYDLYMDKKFLKHEDCNYFF